MTKRRGRAPADMRHKAAVLRAVPGGYTPTKDRQVNSRTVPCPSCKAPVGERCVSRDGNTYQTGYHPHRRRMALRLEREEAQRQQAPKPGWTFSPEVVRKARRYIAEGRVARDPEVNGVWWVTGSDRSRRYRVQTDADPATLKATWINCTCPHGLHLGAGAARCSHAVAVLMHVKAEAEGRIWST